MNRLCKLLFSFHSMPCMPRGAIPVLYFGLLVHSIWVGLPEYLYCKSPPCNPSNPIPRYLYCWNTNTYDNDNTYNNDNDGNNNVSISNNNSNRNNNNSNEKDNDNNNNSNEKDNDNNKNNKSNRKQ